MSGGGLTVKPFASLSSGLLARKGQAKPAMRPQGFGHYGQPGDDLGWNDMGFDAPRPAPPAERPAVVRQQEELQASFEPEPAPAPIAPVLETPAQPAATPERDARKAAFTLRLDGERHLQLRLASAVSGRSSQNLVIEALDALLAAKPELKDLVAKAKKGR
jgi:predicted HicB family RNase H-like nuclease